jgi:molybdopterin molybdotransferase
MAPGRSAGAAPPRAEASLASVEEVAASIAAVIAVVPAAAVPLPRAAGRVLAEPVRAPFPLPRFDNAAMDGYAGQATPPELPVGCACPIATGAPMPAGGMP